MDVSCGRIGEVTDSGSSWQESRETCQRRISGEEEVEKRVKDSELRDKGSMERC